MRGPIRQHQSHDECFHRLPGWSLEFGFGLETRGLAYSSRSCFGRVVLEGVI